MKAPPTLTVEHVPIDRLHPDPANPRWIIDTELEALTRSLRQFGFVVSVLARREDATVIGGHQRLVAARRLGRADFDPLPFDAGAARAFGQVAASLRRAPRRRPGLRPAGLWYRQVGAEEARLGRTSLPCPPADRPP